MILGANVLVFVVLVWLIIIAITWFADNVSVLYNNLLFFTKRTKFWNVHIAPKFRKAPVDPELTVEIPIGSYDPEETMKLACLTDVDVISVGQPQVIFLFEKRHAPPGRRRHAKV